MHASHRDERSQDGLSYEQRSAMIRAYDAKVAARSLGPSRMFPAGPNGEHIHLVEICMSEKAPYKRCAALLDEGFPLAEAIRRSRWA